MVRTNTKVDCGGGSHGGSGSVSERITKVGEQLADSLKSLLLAVTPEPLAPQQLVKTLGQHQVFSQKLVTALRKRDPLATMNLIPGPEPLRRLVQAAKKKGVGADRVRQAGQAIDSFASLIRQVGGDRSGLDAIISSWLPDARASFENVAKQSAYRGMRQLKGIAADVVFFTTFLRPSERGERLDILVLRGYLGLRCVRPGARLRLDVQSSITSVPSDVGHMPFTLSGDAVHELRGGVFVPEFCSGEPISLDFQESGQNVFYSMHWGDEVGMGTTRDIVIAELRENAVRQQWRPGDLGPQSAITDGIDVPTRTYVWDLLLHEDAHRGWVPNLRTLEPGQRGWADPNDPSRDHDELDVQESIEPLGSDVQRFRAEEMPRHVELLEFAYRQMGWDSRQFRGYRTRIDYPIFGSQVQVIFDLPRDPSVSEGD